MKLEDDIKEICLEIENLEKVNSRNSKRKISQLKSTQLEFILDLLKKENSLFNELWNRNLDLLSGNGLKFTVHYENGGYMHSLAKNLKGKINSTGVMFLECSKANVAALTLQKHFYPKSYSGRINALGRVELDVSSTGFNLIGSKVPQSFTGNIGTGGELNLKINKSRFELWGTNFVGKVVCDPFPHDKERRKEFLTNKNKMLKMAAISLTEIENKT